MSSEVADSEMGAHVGSDLGGPVWYDAGALILVSAVSIYMTAEVLFYEGWFTNHDGIRHFVLQEHFNESFATGIWYPRWLPNLVGGYGYPNFVYYPPGLFWLVKCTSYLTGGIGSGLRFALILLFVSGGYGTYLVGRSLRCRWMGCFVAVLFLLTPYLYVNLFVRGALAELTAMLLTPWPIFCLIRMSEKARSRTFMGWNVLGLGLALAAIVYSHPATALVFSPVFLVLSLAQVGAVESGRRMKFFLRLALSGVAALAWSAPYWHTVFTHMHLTDAKRMTGGYFLPSNHFVELIQFFARSWGFGESFKGPHDGLSFALGLPHFFLALLGLMYGFRVRLAQVAFALYLLLLLAMTPYSELLWTHVKLLEKIQFPWRILSVTAILQVLCAAHINPDDSVLKIRGRPVAIPYALLLALVGTWFWLPPLRDVQRRTSAAQLESKLTEQRQKGDIRIIYRNDVNEWLPLTVKQIPRSGRGNQMVAASDPSTSIEYLPGHSEHRILCRVKGVMKSNWITLNQFYFPGWRVRLDGVDLDPQEMAKNIDVQGLIRVDLAGPETHEIEAWYDGPVGWGWRTLIIAFVSVFVVGCVIWEKYQVHFFRANAG